MSDYPYNHLQLDYSILAPNRNRKDAEMETIRIAKTNTKPVGKGGGTIWVSKEVNDELDRLADETGIAKQRITDCILKKALEAVELIECDI